MLKILGTALSLGTLLALLPVPTPPVVAAPDDRPNVVVMVTDDMRLDDLQYMRYTKRLFRAEGTTFKHVLSPHPLCCPARAEMATGQYAQSNGVHHNTGQWGGWNALASSDHLVHSWFYDAGYDTAYIGKFLNGYTGGDIRGLTVNDASTYNVYRPYDVTTWNNGRQTVRPGHQTDWVAQRTVELATRFSGDPFFLWASYVAPHIMTQGGKWVPPVAPARYSSLKQPSHAIPPAMGKKSYNERKIKDKPSWVRDLRRVRNIKVQRRHEARVRSLYAVDDAVRTTVEGLKAAGEYDDTILVFTSDNGVGMGAHRILDKNHPYQEALRVPFLMLGPGVPSGAADKSVGTLVDLPATISARAGVTPARVQDGVDLFRSPEDRAVLIQAGSADRLWRWRGAYTRRYTYVRHWTGERELYDRRTDPEELTNVAGARRYRTVQRRLQRLYHRRLEDCVGAGCLAHEPW